MSDGSALPTEDRLYGWPTYQRLLHEIVVVGNMQLVMVGEWQYDSSFFMDEYKSADGTKYCELKEHGTPDDLFT